MKYSSIIVLILLSVSIVNIVRIKYNSHHELQQNQYIEAIKNNMTVRELFFKNYKDEYKLHYTDWEKFTNKKEIK